MNRYHVPEGLTAFDWLFTRRYCTTVIDSDQYGGESRSSDKGRPGHPDPETKKNFSALRASVWSKNKGAAGPPGPPGPLPWIRHCDKVHVDLKGSRKPG